MLVLKRRKSLALTSVDSKILSRFAFLLLFLAPLISYSAEYRKGERILIDGTFDDTVFAAGNNVEARFQSTDDVFLAAGEVLYSAQSKENVFIAAGDVDVKDGQARAAIIAGGDVKIVHSVMQDLILAGGDVSLDSVEVNDDVIMAGGKIRMDRKSRVGGSMTLAGGDVSLAGTYSGDVMVVGGEVILSGIFEKDVVVRAGELEIAPGAVIRGRLRHTTDKMVVAPGAKIEGDLIEVPREEKDTAKSSGWAKFGWFLFLLFMIATLLVSPILAMLFPAAATRGCGEVKSQFWATFGKGVAVFVLMPVLFFMSVVTIVGIPFALVMVPFFLVGLMLARMVGTFTLGRQFRAWMKKPAELGTQPLGPWARFGWTLLAEVALVILFFVPIGGFLLWIFVLALGLGALYATARESLRKAYSY